MVLLVVRSLLTLSLLFFLMSPGCVFGQSEPMRELHGEYTICDPSGAPLITTTIRPGVGSEFYSPGGFRYRVVDVAGGIANTDSISPMPSGIRYTSPRMTSGAIVSIVYSHPWEGYRPDDQGRSQASVTDVSRGISMSLADTDIEVRSSKLAKNTEQNVDVFLDVQRDTAHSPFVSLPPKQERASSVLMVVHKSQAGWKHNLAFALAWKGLVDANIQGLVRGVLLVDSKATPTNGGVVDEVDRAVHLTLLAGDRFHDPAWVERGLAEISQVLPGLLSKQASGVKPNLGRRLTTIALNPRVVNRETFGYRQWAIAGFVALVTAFALFMPDWDWSSGLAHLRKHVGPAATAFLGSLTDRIKGRHR